MIKTLVANTTELDDEVLAVEQILSQLNLEDNLMKNTIGIMTCHYEFIISDVYKAVCEALPFEIVGTISSTQAVADNAAVLLMTLMVMTSDDVEFVKALTPSLLENPAQVIADSYIAASKGAKPALILAYAPFIMQNCGDDYVTALTEASGNVPVFGTLAVDDTLDFANCFLLADCDHHRDKMAMVLIYGDVNPKFYIANISDHKVLDKSAVITKSMGSVLMEVNEHPVIEYFSDIKLLDAAGKQYAMSSLPFLLDYNDGTPRTSKVFIILTPEKYAICNGAMPEGSTLYMATSDTNDIMLTTGDAVDKILESVEDASLLLCYSCIGRSMTLGAEQFKEIDLVTDKIGGKLPFLMAYSGGEICPTQVAEGKAINRFHNNAFIACVL